MTIPFYTQDELDARIHKERLWIAAYLRASWLDEYGWIEDEAKRIVAGDYRVRRRSNHSKVRDEPAR